MAQELTDEARIRAEVTRRLRPFFDNFHKALGGWIERRRRLDTIPPSPAPTARPPASSSTTA